MRTKKMFNETKLFANVFRIRKFKSTWNFYKTKNGFVVNTGKTYRYWNTGDPFHYKATRIIDIRGDVKVEKQYLPKTARVLYSKRYKFPAKKRLQRVA